MSTNREIYFQYLNKNEYLNKSVIESLIAEANNFSSTNELLFSFDKECLNQDLAISFLESAKAGVPFQYILGKAWFLGEEFYVDNSVLIPRQETEQLVLDSLSLIKDGSMVADICTGSGVISISLKKKNQTLKIVATDIDEKALSIAKRNADKHNVDISFYKGDLLQPIINNNLKLDVLICNPPYIPSKETISAQTWEYEPHLALLASPSTLFYERIFKDHKEIMQDSFMMFFEIGEDMEKQLEILIGKYMPEVKYEFVKDLYNKTRFLHIMKEYE